MGGWSAGKWKKHEVRNRPPPQTFRGVLPHWTRMRVLWEFHCLVLGFGIPLGLGWGYEWREKKNPRNSLLDWSCFEFCMSFPPALPISLSPYPFQSPQTLSQVFFARFLIAWERQGRLPTTGTQMIPILNIFKNIVFIYLF